MHRYFLRLLLVVAEEALDAAHDLNQRERIPVWLP